MQVFDAKLFQIGKSFPYAMERPGPAVHIAHGAYDIPSEIPTALGGQYAVPLPKPAWSGLESLKYAVDYALDPICKIGPVAVEFEEKSSEGFEFDVESALEFRPERRAPRPTRP